MRPGPLTGEQDPGPPQRHQPTSPSRHPARITANLGSTEGPRNRRPQSLPPSGAGISDGSYCPENGFLAKCMQLVNLAAGGTCSPCSSPRSADVLGSSLRGARTFWAGRAGRTKHGYKYQQRFCHVQPSFPAPKHRRGLSIQHGVTPSPEDSGPQGGRL